MGGKKIKYVIGKRKRKKYKKPRIYTHDVFLALKKIWIVFDFICGKRLAPFMAEAIKKLIFNCGQNTICGPFFRKLSTGL